jgi:hypothetical protein
VRRVKLVQLSALAQQLDDAPRQIASTPSWFSRGQNGLHCCPAKYSPFVKHIGEILFHRTVSGQPDAMPTPLDVLRDASSQFTRLERHGSKAVLFLADDPATALYRVVTGCVKLLRSMPDRRCQILRFCGPGQVSSHDCADRARC